MLSLRLRFVVSSLALSGASRQIPPSVAYAKSSPDRGKSFLKGRAFFQNDPPDEPPKPSESVDEPPEELDSFLGGS